MVGHFLEWIPNHPLAPKADLGHPRNYLFGFRQAQNLQLPGASVSARVILDGRKHERDSRELNSSIAVIRSGKNWPVAGKRHKSSDTAAANMRSLGFSSPSLGATPLAFRFHPLTLADTVRSVSDEERA